MIRVAYFFILILAAGCASDPAVKTPPVPNIVPQTVEGPAEVGPVVLKTNAPISRMVKSKSVSLPTPGISIVPHSIGLQWEPSPDDDVAAYNIYYGTESRAYLNLFQAGNNTNCVITGLVGGVTYYFAATAVDTFGMESDFSDELVDTPEFLLDISFAFNQTVTNLTLQSSPDLIQWQNVDAVPTNGVFRVRVDPQSPFTVFRGSGTISQ